MRMKLGILGIIVVMGCGVVVFLAVRKTPYSPPKVTEEARAVAAAANDFGFRLLAEMRQNRKDNIFFSPTSLSMALSMAYNGAVGSTKDGMAKALDVQGIDLEKLNAGQQNLLDLAKRSDPTVTVNIANALWAQKGYRFLPDFIATNRQSYRARVTALDLANQKSAGTINAWVKRETKGKIDNLVQPDDFDEDTRLVLTNAVYFNGPWTLPFDRQRTEDGPFTLNDGTVKQVPMMTQTEGFNYFDGDGFRAVSLPYGIGILSMLILLPDLDRSLDDLLPELKTKNLDNWTGQFNLEQVTVILPRFKVDFESEINQQLTALGMGDAFNIDRADFSDIDGQKDNLYISLVRHKALLEVSEERTEAAAATSVGMPTSAAVAPPAEPIIFKVDRPFLCAIRDERSGALLFLGAIENPE